MMTTLYLKCTLGDVGPRALLVGDPARVERIGALLDRACEVARNREYRVVTGFYQGQQVSAVSAGIGAPSTAIALEELGQVGVRAVVRVGTMMGVGAPLGTLVVPTGAARYEGTSPRYLPIEFPAVPDWRLAQGLAESGHATRLPVHLGLSATYDAFYPDMAPELAPHHPPADWETLRRAGVLGLDMESALVFVAGQVLGLATATICLVTVQAGPSPEFLARDVREDLEQRLIRAALEGLAGTEVAKEPEGTEGSP